MLFRHMMMIIFKAGSEVISWLFMTVELGLETISNGQMGSVTRFGDFWTFLKTKVAQIFGANNFLT